MGCAASKHDHDDAIYSPPNRNLGGPPASQHQFSAGHRAPADDDDDESCEFFFVDADFLRSHRGTTPLPHFQRLKEKYPSALHRKRYTMTEVVMGVHVKEDLIISHRWLDPKKPDPDHIFVDIYSDYTDILG